MKKKNPYDNDFVNKVTRWISTQEGQEALDKSIKKAEEKRKEFEKSYQLDPNVLNKVIGF